MRPVILRDEIEVFRLGRIEGSLNGVLARVAYGSWGQSPNDVGIIRGIALQIPLG